MSIEVAIIVSRESLEIFESSKGTMEHREGMGAGAGGASTMDISHFQKDYELLKKALAAQGITYKFVPWDAKNEEWSKYDAAMIYAPWYYYRALDSFLQKLDEIEKAGVTILNSVETMKWNTHKKYLQELEEWRIPIIPTRFVDNPKETADITAKLSEIDTGNGFVLKKCVSAGGDDVFFPETIEEAQAIYQEKFVGETESIILQPRLNEVREEGEYSFVFLDGEYSNCFLRTAAKGDCKVQHASDKEDLTNSIKPDFLRQAKQIYSKIVEKRYSTGEPPLILRVDAVNCGGVLKVMEIEQVDPFLYLYTQPNLDDPSAAANKLVKGFLRQVNNLNKAFAQNKSAPPVTQLSADMQVS